MLIACARKIILLVALSLAFGFHGYAESPAERLAAFLARTPHPQSANEFALTNHQSPLSQGDTYICWSFSTSSFLESEMQRLHQPAMRLSVNYPVYCEYLEKMKRFVQTKGTSRFAAGDLYSAIDICQRYGVLPASAYGDPATIQGQKQLYKDLDALLRKLKAENIWNEAAAMAATKAILNHYLGEPPRQFAMDGKSFTPQSFRDETVKLPWDQYAAVTSFSYGPFHSYVEMKVEDNWQHRTNFFNVPLAEFYDAFKGALQKGFTLAADIDNTEPSYETTKRYCFIPDYEVAARDLNQQTRDAQFASGATTDDHLLHVVGYKNITGEDWFLAKDSWKATWNQHHEGYIFIHSSYVKLKVLSFLVHRDAVPEIGLSVAKK